VAKELLYIEDFATRRIYFRRLRVPPLVTVYWRFIIANHFLRKFMRRYVADGQRAIVQGDRALEKIRWMRDLAVQVGLPCNDFDFQYDTFEIIAAVRHYYFGDFDERIIQRLEALKAAYEAKYPEPRYALMLDFSRFRLRRTHLRLMLKVMFRGEHGYRLVDRIVILNVLSLLYPVLKRLNRRVVPAFAKDSAMGFDAIFK